MLLSDSLESVHRCRGLSDYDLCANCFELAFAELDPERTGTHTSSHVMIKTVLNYPYPYKTWMAILGRIKQEYSHCDDHWAVHHHHEEHLGPTSLSHLRPCWSLSCTACKGPRRCSGSIQFHCGRGKCGKDQFSRLVCSAIPVF